MEDEREGERGSNLFHGKDLTGANKLIGGFTGRRDQMHFLHAALDAAGNGCGRLVLLSGGQGIGKTRTAAEFAKQAKHRGVPCLWARCSEGERTTRLEPWTQILEQCVSGLEASSLQNDAAPGLSEVAARTRRYPDDGQANGESEWLPPSLDLFGDIFQLLRDVACRAPLVVVLDDLQDVDLTSLRFLQFLTHHLDDLPLMILATFREEGLPPEHPLRDALVELGRSPATQYLDLHGLDAKKIAQLVETNAGGEMTEREISALQQCTDGNPLFILELLRALGVDGVRDLPENGLRIVPATPSVRAIVSRRLAALSKGCRRRCGGERRRRGIAKRACAIDRDAAPRGIRCEGGAPGP
jgi:predicted ATPase